MLRTLIADASGAAADGVAVAYPGVAGVALRGVRGDPIVAGSPPILRAHGGAMRTAPLRDVETGDR
jgi:hypothetical protein